MELKNWTTTTATRKAKKQKVSISKTTTLHVHHTFSYISSRSPHDQDLEVLNFTFFFKPRQSPLEFNPRKVHQNLTNRTIWNKSEEFWNSLNSLFCHLRRLRCLNSHATKQNKWNPSEEILVKWSQYHCFFFYLLSKLGVSNHEGRQQPSMQKGRTTKNIVYFRPKSLRKHFDYFSLK